MMIADWDNELQQMVCRPATQEEIDEMANMVGRNFTSQRAAYLDEVRTMREKVLNRLTGVAAQLMLLEPPEQTEEKALCAVLMQGLLDITTIPSVEAATTMPDLKAAVKAEYARLVGLANAQSPNLVKAFRQVSA